MKPTRPEVRPEQRPHRRRRIIVNETDPYDLSPRAAAGCNARPWIASGWGFLPDGFFRLQKRRASVDGAPPDARAIAAGEASRPVGCGGLLLLEDAKGAPATAEDDTSGGTFTSNTDNSRRGRTKSAVINDLRVLSNTSPTRRRGRVVFVENNVGYLFDAESCWLVRFHPNEQIVQANVCSDVTYNRQTLESGVVIATRLMMETRLEDIEHRNRLHSIPSPAKQEALTELPRRLAIGKQKGKPPKGFGLEYQSFLQSARKEPVTRVRSTDMQTLFSVLEGDTDSDDGEAGRAAREAVSHGVAESIFHLHSTAAHHTWDDIPTHSVFPSPRKSRRFEYGNWFSPPQHWNNSMPSGSSTPRATPRKPASARSPPSQAPRP